MSTELRENLGTRRIVKLPPPRFPDADAIVRTRAIARSRESKVDVLLVNPPSPDGGIWIRTQHRVGRRSRENMIWPQVSLAQMAALLVPDYTVEIVDAIAMRMGWAEFGEILRDRRPLYYLTQVTAPTLTNDMYGVFLAKSNYAVTMAFGTHVTPLARETLRQFPALDFVLRGEPEMTLRELIDTFEIARGRWHVTESGHLAHAKTGEAPHGHERMWSMWSEADPTWQPPWTAAAPTAGRAPAPSAAGSNGHSIPLEMATTPVMPAQPAENLLPWVEPAQLAAIKGLGWRRQNEILVNWDRPFFKSLDDLPHPLHHLLPLDKYRMPMIKGPYTFIVTSRGCPAGCKYCIKHVSYQNSVRLRSPEKLMEEMWLLHDLGIHHIHMYSDLFTVNREQVVELCQLIIKENLKITWTCNSRVDYVDEEMLRLMGRAGCMLISWGIESGNELILKKAHKGYKKEQAFRALKWAKQAGIKNWGYFIIGLPGETVETIQETMALSKKLPLDIALFHVAAPYPGTPFFFEVVENNWFRPDTNWEEVDMDQATVLDYGNLSAEDLLMWQKRAFREWAFRPRPILTMLKSMNTWAGLKSGLDIGLQTLGWVKG
jgi:anaerobic magnesium-protoporphyrin IX monomethyl ester cyclase